MTDEPRDGRGSDVEFVEAPPLAGQYETYRVAGDSNYPAFFAGDIIYTAPARPPEEVIGKRCVAQLANGERRVCMLGAARRQAPMC